MKSVQKLSLLAFALVASATVHAESRGHIVAASCVANRNMFKKDRCTPVKISGDTNCYVTVSSNGVNATHVSIEHKGQVLSGSVNGPFERMAGYQKSNIGRMGRLTEGQLIMNTDGRGHAASPREVQIWVNKDSSGSQYTRYTCTGFSKAHVVTAARPQPAPEAPTAAR